MGKNTIAVMGSNTSREIFCEHVTKKPHTNPDMSKMLTLNLWWLMIPRKTGAT